MTSNESNNYWDHLAAQFQHQQPPLRPSADDVHIYERAIHDCARHSGGGVNSLLFGVTPEIAGLAWPDGTQLLAVEKSQPMIDRIWLGDIPGRRQVRRENWFNLKVEDRSLDIVIGDGVLTPLGFPNQYAELARLIARWLKPEGRAILRVFVRPTRRETFEEILADLKANRIARFDILKWRLAMMLQNDVREGVVLNDVFEAWAKLLRQHPLVIEQTGWPRATMDTIRLYDGRKERYTFPTLDELSEAFSLELQQVEIITPHYDFGERCPTVIYSPRR